MKIFQKIISVLTTLCIGLSLSAITVFADHTRVVDLNEDELYDRVWNSIVSSVFDISSIKRSTANGDQYDTLIMSIYYKEYQTFMLNYEPFYDDDISDVHSKFINYFDTVYNNDTQIELENDIMVQYNTENPNEKSYWTYDQNQDRYVCKDTNGKLLKSIPKYHLDDEASLPQTSTSSNTSDISRNIDNDSNSHNTTPARQDSITDTVSIVEDTQVSEEIVYESAEESSLSQSQSNEMVAEETYIDDTSGNQTSRDRKTIVSGVIDEETAIETFVPDIAEKESNNFVQVVLIIIGILVIIGIVIIIVMLKRKAANKNEE